jgi:hypothetical protein
VSWPGWRHCAFLDVNGYLADLERMVNQIARNFASRPFDEAAAGIADHLQRFWDPSMRHDLAEALASGQIKVSAVVQAAVNSAL